MSTQPFGVTGKFDIHDITVQHTGTFGTGGRWKSQTLVRYYVGENGPFQLTYDQGQDTADNIRMDIQKQVTLLQQIGA